MHCHDVEPDAFADPPACAFMVITRLLRLFIGQAKDFFWVPASQQSLRQKCGRNQANLWLRGLM
jgi:hypothetical protein